ncbi:MAG: tripartite tricarboxylate transporter TctB family protein [Salinisphaera sp.]|jgi:putative tricarboxylic transport membrane protein|nr:tripartite tricarboxylate transporter TctB family protein [Salinisphaera sp.]
MSAPHPDTAVHSMPENGQERAQALGHIVFNGVLLSVFALLYFRAESLPASMWEPLGSGSFPKLALGVLMVFNVALIAQQAFRLWASSALPHHSVRHWLWRHRLAFVVLALFALYTLALPWVGFGWASMAFLLVTQLALGGRGPRALIAVVLVSLVFSFGLSMLFGDVFNIILPPPAWQ